MMVRSRWYSTLSRRLVTLILVLLGLNLASWAVLARWPGLLRAPEDALPLQVLKRYTDGDLKLYREDWYGIGPGEWPDFLQEAERFGVTAPPVENEDYTGARLGPFRGKYFNIHDGGFRELGTGPLPWPPNKQSRNIFLLGDSTVMGVTADAATIARFLHDGLNKTSSEARPVTVYNFGRPAYQSAQQAILFEMLLRKGIVPDAAIFLGGMNDFLFLDGRTALSAIYDAALKEAVNRGADQARGPTRPVLRWDELASFLRALPAVQLLEAVQSRIQGAPKSAPDYQPVQAEQSQLEAAVARYKENMRITQTIGDAYGVKTAFVIQPTPAYAYDPKKHIALDPRWKLFGHERSGQGYPLLRAAVESGGMPGRTVIWAADLHRDFPGGVYVDVAHYTRGFSKALADFIAKELVGRGFFQPGSEKAAQGSAESMAR